LAVGQLEWVEEPIRFPEMEFNLASASESQTGTTDSNSEFSSMEISDMVPRPYEFINFPTASVSSENSNNLPQKRKIASNRQQALDSNDLADRRRVLHEQGLSDLPVDIVVLKNDLSSVNPGTISPKTLSRL
ncbi:hypothetical protein AYI69_g775, partial [Smittium culicis]